MPRGRQVCRAPHPERLSASDREQTRPGGDTLQTPACFSLGRDPVADGCLEHLGLCPQARRRMWTQDGPPCPRASARAGPSCHLGAPPHRSLPPHPPSPTGAVPTHLVPWGGSRWQRFKIARSRAKRGRCGVPALRRGAGQSLASWAAAAPRTTAQGTCLVMHSHNTGSPGDAPSENGERRLYH